VIEDAAQAIGTEYKDGRRVGGIGDIGCFSFFPTKNLGGLGDAGILTTRSPELAERARVLRVHGSKPKYYHRMIGGNFRIDTLHAAALAVKLAKLDTWTRERRQNAVRYESLFENSGLLSKKQVELPRPVYAGKNVPHAHIYNQYVIRVDRRDQLMAFLQKQGVGCEVYYPLPLHLQECFQTLGYTEGEFPESERAAKTSLAIPIFPGLNAKQQKYVVDQIDQFFNPRRN